MAIAHGYCAGVEAIVEVFEPAVHPSVLGGPVIPVVWIVGQERLVV